jgi:hypothetical protein
MIRRFSTNASSMTKLAARDFEDLLQVCKHADVRICVKLTCLQCSIPVFELLLPAPQNKILMDVLFELCTWHALAKLRLHTKATARDLKTSTRRLGFVLQDFKKVVCMVHIIGQNPRKTLKTWDFHAVQLGSQWFTVVHSGSLWITLVHAGPTVDQPGQHGHPPP